MYLEDNKSTQEIANYYNCKRSQINYLLKKNNLQKDFSESRRKYKLNINYFNDIDTPNKAYILGFLYADGYNNQINNTVVLSLKYTDKDILEKIRKEIGCEKPLFENKYISKFDNVERHMFSLILASKHISKQLEEKGMVQNKTFIIGFPFFLKEELYSHFIRGYFDGDGCVSILKDSSKSYKESLTVSIISSKKMCEEMQKVLENNGIYFNLNSPTGKSENNKIIRSKSYENCYNFMKYIYKDADLYMNRKKEIFLKYFSE